MALPFWTDNLDELGKHFFFFAVFFFVFCLFVCFLFMTHITVVFMLLSLPRGVAKFVGKLGTRLRTSQLHCEVPNVVANFET